MTGGLLMRVCCLDYLYCSGSGRFCTYIVHTLLLDHDPRRSRELDQKLTVFKYPVAGVEFRRPHAINLDTNNAQYRFR